MVDVILIPGLGQNHNERMFLWLRPLWRLCGIRLHICELRWEDGEPFEPKYQRLHQLAADLPNLSGIVGASAGASAAVCLAAREPELVNRVAIVCGLLEVSYVDPVSMQKRSPAFLKALSYTTDYLKTDAKLATQLLTIRPLRDGVVDPSVATVSGATDVRVHSVGHAFSIGYILTFRIGLIKKFLLAQKQDPLTKVSG